MAGIANDQAADYYYQDDLYLDRPEEKFSCPICLCPVQRQAYLTECCGRHFCLSCISRLRNDAKPCPMCKATPLTIFPNKERQREIKQIRVRCPLSLDSYSSVGGRGGSGSSGETNALSEERDAKLTQECCLGTPSGVSNTSDSPEVANLSTVIDSLKLCDKDNLTTKEQTSTEKQLTTSGEPGSVDHVKDGDVITCNWIGELGQVEDHVSAVHGAEALQRIKNDDSDSQPSGQGSCARVHGHRFGVLPLHAPNFTFHYVRTQNGVNLHYNVGNFTSSSATPTSDPTRSEPRDSDTDQTGDVHLQQQQQLEGVALVNPPFNHWITLSDFMNMTRESPPAAPSQQSEPRGGVGGQRATGGNGQLQGVENQTRCNRPNSLPSTGQEPINSGHLDQPGLLLPHLAPSSQAQSDQTVSEAGRQQPQPGAGSPNQPRPSAVVLGQASQPPASGHYVVIGQPLFQPVPFVRPRGCPYRYHMGAMRRGGPAHHGVLAHHFRYHHHPRRHGHFAPHGPPPNHPSGSHPPHGSPPPPGPHPHGFPPRLGQGGHPHHHHPHGSRPHCHGHYHRPPTH